MQRFAVTKRTPAGPVSSPAACLRLFQDDVVGAVDFAGKTALHHAAKKKLTDVCAGLVDRYRTLMDPDAISSTRGQPLARRHDNHGFTALHLAAAAGATEICELLTNEYDRATTQSKGRFQMTALHCAAEAGQARACFSLLPWYDRDALVQRDQSVRSILHWAAFQGLEDVALAVSPMQPTATLRYPLSNPIPSP